MAVDDLVLERVPPPLLRRGESLFGLAPARIIDAAEDTLTVAVPTAGAGELTIVVTNRDGNHAVAGGVFRYYS